MGSQLYRQHHDGLPPNASDRALIAASGAAMVMTALMPLDVVVKKLQVGGAQDVVAQAWQLDQAFVSGACLSKSVSVLVTLP